MSSKERREQKLVSPKNFKIKVKVLVEEETCLVQGEGGREKCSEEEY